MRLLRAALTCALILACPWATAKQSCVEILASGEPSTAPAVRSERQRETRIERLLLNYFTANPLPGNLTGRLQLLPADGKVSLASEEFDEVVLHPLAMALAPEREILDLLTGQVHTKVNNAVYVEFHEGKAVGADFYNPRTLPEKPFSKSEYSGEVRAVPLNSEAGQALLREARAAGLSDEAIVNYYQPQSFTTFCGIASSCMVLSSIHRRPLSQDTLMRWNTHVKPDGVVKAQLGQDPGFQLGQLVRLLNSRNERAVAVYALELSDGPTHLRADIVETLGGSGQKIILNFHGLTLGTLTGGHFSPVAAFVPESNMVLVLDTAAHKNEPFWIPLADLYFAMTKIDAAAGLPRGWIRVGRSRMSPPAAE